MVWTIPGVGGWHSVQKASPTPGMALFVSGCVFSLEGVFWSCALGLGSEHPASPAAAALSVSPFQLAFRSTEGRVPFGEKEVGI